MTQTHKDYKNSSGRITKTQVVGLQKLKWLIFSLFNYYDIFEQTHWLRYDQQTIETLRFLCLNERNISLSQFAQLFSLAKTLQRSGT